jgi:hypothetical protein
MIAILLIAPVALALAALKWGVDSGDSIDSVEWERRQYWDGFY